jgi:hypothetical protein
MNKALTLLLCLFLLALLAGLIGLGWIWFVGKDEAVMSDSDLALPEIVLPSDTDNIYNYLAKVQPLDVSEANQYFLNSFFEDDIFNLKTAKPVIVKNQKFLEQFGQALEHTSYQDPTYEDVKGFWAGSILEPGLRLEAGARFYLFNAVFLFYQGQETEAFEAALKLVRLGHLIEQSQGPAVQYLIGLRIKEEGLKIIRLFTSKTRLPVKTLLSYFQQLSNLADSSLGLRNALRVEYLMEANNKSKAFDNTNNQQAMSLLGVGRGALDNFRREFVYFYKPNKTKNILIQHFQQLIANASKLYYQEIREALPNPKETAVSPNFFLALAQENILGRRYLNNRLNSFSQLFKNYFTERFSVLGTQVLLAVRAYWQDNAKLPVSLSDLTSNYLTNWPRDPFDAQLLRYSSQKKIIYAVGFDLNDTGGSEGKNPYKMFDPSVIIGW